MRVMSAAVVDGSARLAGRRSRPESSPRLRVSVSLWLIYLSFKVERLNSANRIARITNRKTILDSFHPTISK